MGLPWYRVHTVVLNDPGRLIAVHLMHIVWVLLNLGVAGQLLVKAQVIQVFGVMKVLLHRILYYLVYYFLPLYGIGLCGI